MIRWLCLVSLLLACEDPEDAQKRREREAWNGPCADQATLLATTSGSPSDVKCPNKRHRMEVQVATQPTNEEAAALVFCKCVLEDGGR